MSRREYSLSLMNIDLQLVITLLKLSNPLIALVDVKTQLVHLIQSAHQLLVQCSQVHLV
jgi:hypothetical protein